MSTTIDKETYVSNIIICAGVSDIINGGAGSDAGHGGIVDEDSGAEVDDHNYIAQVANGGGTSDASSSGSGSNMHVAVVNGPADSNADQAPPNTAFLESRREA
jgi:hypothetical protein